MLKSRTGRLIALFFALASWPGAALAGQDAEFYVNTYRSVGTVSTLGQRAAGMGRTSVGIADGVASIGENPAGLGAFTGYGAETGLGIDWLDDGSDGVSQVNFRLGGAMSLERWQPCGRFNQTIGGQLYTENYSGAGGVGMKRGQTGFTLAYGAHLMDDLIGGVSASLFDGKWKADGTAVPIDRSFTGGEFKVGAIYRVSDKMTAGGTLGYSTGAFREKADYATGGGSGSLDRWNIKAGVGYQLTDETLLAGDIWYDHMKTKVPSVLSEKNTAWGLSAGIEQQVLPEVMALRGGIYYDRTSYGASGSVADWDVGSFGKGRVGLTAGIGIRLYSFDIGYSLDVNTGGDIKNFLDVTAEW